MREESVKPKCKLTGTDGNVFALAGRVVSTLKDNGQHKEAGEVGEKVFNCKSYEEALNLFADYVDVS